MAALSILRSASPTSVTELSNNGLSISGMRDIGGTSGRTVLSFPRELYDPHGGDTARAGQACHS